VTIVSHSCYYTDNSSRHAQQIKAFLVSRALNLPTTLSLFCCALFVLIRIDRRRFGYELRFFQFTVLRTSIMHFAVWAVTAVISNR
jgi:hypothetical protein